MAATGRPASTLAPPLNMTSVIFVSPSRAVGVLLLAAPDLRTLGSAMTAAALGSAGRLLTPTRVSL